MVQKQQDKKGCNEIQGVGLCIPRRTLSTSQVKELFGKDLRTARSLTYEDPTGYFTRKARMIESAQRDFSETKKGSFHAVGYEPGLKYIYPGLPVEFAEKVDPAIREIIDLIARCEEVAMTGFCCAGHPSSVIHNPHYNEYLENPMRARMMYGENCPDPIVHSRNSRPRLFLLLHEYEKSTILRNSLLRLSASATLEGNATIDIKASDFFSRKKLPGFTRISLHGEPTLNLLRQGLEHRDFVGIYQKALSELWLKIQGIFQRLVGMKVPEPVASHFGPKQTEWGREWQLIQKRHSNGFRLPNYYYFDGQGLITPQFSEKRTGTNHL